MPRGRLLFTLALAAALVGAGGAATQTSEPLTVTTFVINGRGWGHGVGMSQWGAYGYAKHGVSYEKILSHYYPGTTLSETPVVRIKVLLVEKTRKLAVSSTDAFRVKDGAGKTHDLDAGIYAFDTRFRLRLRSGKPAKVLPGPLTFIPGKSPLWLAHPWRGSLLVTANAKAMSVVNTVSIESYVRGVVSSEMPHDWPLEAVKAQAVAARSYALSHLRGGAFDVYNDTRDQVYGGIAAETPLGDEAVADTKRQVLLYDGKVASTYFFSTSGGRTSAVADVFANSKPTPYLVSVPDPYDTASPYHTWGPVVVPAGTAAKQLRVPGLSDLQPVPAAGRARTVVATGRDGDETLSAADVRRALGLRSTWMTVGVLSLSRPPGKVQPGTTVRLSGRVEHLDDPFLEQRVGDSAWQPAAELEFQPDGSFTVDVAPTSTTQFRLAAGDIRSGALRVVVSSP
jgi:stage II sporulation protein D